MDILSQVSLKPYNTFGIGVTAKYFAEIRSAEDFLELQQHKVYKDHPALILGGGSNVLLTKDIDGLVIKNNLKGIELVKEDTQHVYVKCAAGEVWQDFVMHCIGQQWAGLENLSLIPGCTGASPMQNIGAYGVEIKDVFHELEALDMRSGEKRLFTAHDCQFGYRESVFKRRYKGQYFITSVTFRLNKQPAFHIDYGAIRQELDHMKVSELSIRAISQAVINIRRSKLPDPAVTGNAGSFFKNPEVSADTYQQLKQQFPDVVAYPTTHNQYKLAAGWLIEQCGLKGYRVNDAGVHMLQALVLVNYGQATGQEIYDLSTHVMQSVDQKFGVQLEREVNII